MFCNHWDNFITFISNFSITVELQRLELCNAAEEKMLLEQLMWDDVGFEGFPRGTVPIPPHQIWVEESRRKSEDIPVLLSQQPQKTSVKSHLIEKNNVIAD